MRILYAFPEELPLSKARGLQSCATVSALGKQNTIWFAAPFKKDPFSFYQFSKSPGVRLVNISRKIGLFKSTILWALKLRLLIAKIKPHIIFLRHFKLAYYLLKWSIKPLVFEVHEILQDKHSARENLRDQEDFLYRKVSGLVFISQGLRSRAQEIYKFKKPYKIIPSGTFLCKKCANKKLEGEVEDIYYVGTAHYSWKGIDTLLEALRKTNFYLHIVGPFISREIPVFLQDRIKIYGWQSPKKIYDLLYAAQIGVLPNTGSTLISRFYTSPMKLLDYMATKTAVVAADLPSVRELVSEKEVLFFEPDNPSSLAEALKRLSQNPSLREELASNAYRKAKYFTWDQRADRLSRFFEEILYEDKIIN